MGNIGGSTLMLALLTGSPATLRRGGNSCEVADQRNFGRLADGDGNGSARCDIGAVEAALPGSGVLVTTTTDDLTNNGNCSLREAIRAANLNTAVDACPAGSRIAKASATVQSSVRPASS